MLEENIIQLGAVAIIFILAIREFFTWLKNRGDDNGKEKILTIIHNLLKQENEKTTLKIENLQKQVINLKDNDLHTLVNNQKEIKVLQIKHCEDIAELKTIINERIPKKL